MPLHQLLPRLALRSAVFAGAMTVWPVAHAQFLQGLLDHAKTAAQQAAQQAAQDEASRAATDVLQGKAGKSRKTAPAAASAPAPARVDAAGEPAPPPVAAAPAPAAIGTAPEPSGLGPMPPQLAFTTRLASGVRTQDFRKGVPPELRDGQLPERRTELANPYLPDNRRIFKVWAMAPHPRGGIIFWADARHARSTDDNDEWSGLWRMESDGRVTPYAVESEAQFQRTRVHCGGAFDQVSVGRPDALIVEPGEDVLLAQSSHGVILRIHRNGYVERVAGGGEDWCTRNNPSDTGHRDGPGPLALLSNQLAFAQARDGGLYGTEENAQRADQLTRIRHIDPRGNVTTIFTGADCTGGSGCPLRTVGADTIVVDRDGKLVVAAQRLGRNARGQFQGQATAYRLDPSTLEATPLALAVDLVPLPGTPFDNFGGLALLPDGRPIAWSMLSGGFVLLDGEIKPTLNFWMRWSPRGDNDGPVATSGFGNRQFCVASDGTIFALTTDHSVRRLDPVAKQVSTWLR